MCDEASRPSKENVMNYDSLEGVNGEKIKKKRSQENPHDGIIPFGFTTKHFHSQLESTEKESALCSAFTKGLIGIRRRIF